MTTKKPQQLTEEEKKKMGMGIGADYVAEIPLEQSSLLTKPEEHIAVITHNRPHVRNEILVPELTYWHKLFTEANHDRDVKVIILNANGTDFSAGDNLRQLPVEFAGLRPKARLAKMERLHRFYTGMGGPGPLLSNRNTIASVQGLCCGSGGFDLVTDCDLCIACECARFGSPENRLGLGGLARPQLILNIGWKRTRELYLTGGTLSAQKAMEWGLVNDVVPHDDEHKKLREETMRWARMICLHPRDGLTNSRVSWNNILRILGIDAAYDYRKLSLVMGSDMHWRPGETDLNFLKLRKDHGVDEATRIIGEAWAKLGFYTTGLGEGYGYTAVMDKKARQGMPASAAKKRG